MGLLDLSSNQSFWKGYEYYTQNKVLSCVQTGNGQYTGQVSGSDSTVYDVSIDIIHPKRSICNCPHAEGQRRICKHKVAMYCSLFPEQAEKIIQEAEDYERQEEQRIDELHKEIEKYVNSLSKEELRRELLWRMIDESDRNNYW